jgi:hypothetical protein
VLETEGSLGLPLYLFLPTVILLSSPVSVSVSLCSCILTSAENKGSGMFLSCNILNRVGLYTWSNAFL